MAKCKALTGSAVKGLILSKQDRVHFTMKFYNEMATSFITRSDMSATWNQIEKILLCLFCYISYRIRSRYFNEIRESVAYYFSRENRRRRIS